ncbi:hypothetical protein HYH03_014377 [Edaphochlamys debaryana]|uniref:Glyoxal oxidase N-terminal domain-containing protein n=1 Tax=Edaphochlamys debaryana TaxID=47281 RepID=A0A835XP12_9CHLO|nr:hypothetical protein HYH03_014377 [Edaphochlamys debaryana]|eukprot:KAG2487005.1 hypothetical protein HYH03_014377 [Edaphochlamys debaryana]
MGRYDFLALSMIVAVHMVQIPGTDNYLFMERPSGYHPDGSRTIAGYLDIRTRKWKHIFSPDGLFCCGHTLLDNGDVVIVGGHQANAGYPDGMKSVRTFNKTCTDLNLRKVNEMSWRRWYPTATLLPPGWVMIMGGTQGVGAGTSNNPFWEMYYPETNELVPNAMRPQFLDQAEQVYYPFNYVLPSGYLFTFCGRSGWIMDYMTNTWVASVPRLRGYGSTQFPFTGTSVLLGLYPETNYQVEIMLFGGQKEAANKNLTIVANRGANRLRVTYDEATNNFTFGENGWVYEDMPVGRVMPDSVLLPNGKVVILNGANAGLAGDSAGGGDSRADYPILHADIYDPDAPAGERFKSMAKTKIARMYHSVACLTTDGTVIVSGCDRCYRFQVYPGDDYIPSPTSKAEYRTEIFTPPYFYYDEVKPRITYLPSDVMQYETLFTFGYTFPSYADRPVAAYPPPPNNTTPMPPRPPPINRNRRPRRPPTHPPPPETPPPPPPPSMYMLFALNGDIYSTAKWITIPRPPPGGTGWRWGITPPDAKR